MKITRFDQVNALYHSGVNICKGCKRENAASCTKEHFYICNAQAQKHTKEIINK